MEFIEVLHVAYDWVICLVIDYIAFLAIDCLSKSKLLNKKTALERRRVWLHESAWLAIASIAIYYVHHVPFVLLLFVFLTFIYAIFHGRASFLQAMETVKARWNEFKEHHESLEELREMEKSRGYANHVSSAQQADFLRASAAPTIVINPQNTKPGLNPAGQLRSLRFNEQKAMYEFVGAPAGEGHVTGESGPPMTERNVVSDASAVHVPCAENNLHSAVGNGGQILLRRRPLRELTPSETLAPRAESVLTNGRAVYALQHAASRSWGSRVLSAFGLGGSSQASPGGDGAGQGLPPGLHNPGSGLCFVNAVIQCLARSPNLADELAEESKGAVVTGAHPCQLALLDVCSELMQKINVHPAENDTPVLDHPLELRDAASQLNADLFSGIDKPQLQQDAAEFLTWLLSELHDVINESNSKGCRKMMEKSYLQQLKLIYGDITPRQCEQLKAGCWQEISDADGLSMKSYAEPVQRLSDMEWLSYKQKNYSIIDDLFTGQMIETRVCTNCASIAVSIQTFNLLSVPLPEVQGVAKSMAITLDSCLEAYGTVETLSSIEAVRCDACLRRMSKGSSRFGITLQTATPSNAMSPIPGLRNADISGMEGTFLTSTPTAQPSSSGAKSERSYGAMQRRSLLRQLPDCLILQLMRFHYDTVAQQSRKIKTAVTVPLDNLDLSRVIYDAVTCRLDLTSSQNEGGSGATCYYGLYGLCLHLGAESTSYGHYTAYARAVDGRWYMFDDEAVVYISDMKTELLSKVVQENCYLLFYRRQLV